MPAAGRAARQLVSPAPLRESGYRCLLQALAAPGNVAEALHVYTSLCDTLRDELGVVPGASTRQLSEQLIVT